MSAWAERRLAEISAEIRAYPTPIARCDLQLAALLEERDLLIKQQQQQGCSAEALWCNDGGFHAA